MDTIDSFRLEYDFLSNYYVCDLLYDDVIFKSSEAMFQSFKCTNRNERIEFAKLSAKDSKKRGKEVELREGWDEVKIEYMKMTLQTKFTQNRSLAKKLIKTGDKMLIEGNTWHDNYWGNCVCSKCRHIQGENHLGKLLMEVREELKETITDTFKIIIAGGRDFNNYEQLKEKCDHLLSNIKSPIEIVSGTANGADKLGERYADEEGYKLTKFPANWKIFGNRAGYLRNKEMGEYADACICFWDERSKGTKNMIDISRILNLKLRVVKYKNK